jgi:hypothetical protein
MLQEWVAEVGSKAGLTQSNARLSSGSIGVAESRLEVRALDTAAFGTEPCSSRVPQLLLARTHSRVFYAVGPQLEVSFSSLSEFEHFLSLIPAREHRAWSQRVQSLVVGGTPRWEVRCWPRHRLEERQAQARESRSLC